MAENPIISTNPASIAPPQGPLTCFHCGEDCPDGTIHIDEKLFCCQGCRMVYEILNTHQLTQYYTIDDKPGISRRREQKVHFAWLDDDEIAGKLVDFRDDKVSRITLQLPQIHCASCIWLLEHLYKLQPGIVQSTVNFMKKEAHIVFEHETVTLRAIAELLSAIGYTPQLNLDSLDEEKKVKAVDRTLYYQLGVAGFAFGNIMLLSFPEYLGLGEDHFQSLFGYLNILLALPVLLYSARPYLQSAWTGLREGYLNIDVPITLGILTLFGRSVFEILSLGEAGYLDSLAGLVFFLLVGKWFQQKTYHRLSFERDYKSYFPVAATLRTADGERSVALHKLNMGDTIIVRNGELIPADSILLKGNAMVDYSFVTGESDPVGKSSGEKIFAGGKQTGEAIELTVVKKVSESYLTQLWNDSAFEKAKKHQTASDLADAIGKKFTYAILAISALTLMYWLPRDIGVAVNAFTAVLIIACPCAVALSVPFTFGNVIRFMARHGFYLKNTLVIENLARANTVVFDKTGTITQAATSDVRYDGRLLTDQEKAWFAALARQSTHPVSRHIAGYLAMHNGAQTINNFEETPGTGVKGEIDGRSIEMEKHESGTVLKIDGEVAGVVRISNQYRPGFIDVVTRWRDRSGMYVLSGDRPDERPFLEQYFRSENLHFEQSPRDKLDFISNLKAENADFSILMIGDGLNDAGALQRSDTGIVVAEDTNNFTPACDAILDASKFNRLPEFLELSKKSIRVVYLSYALAFVYNVVGLSFAVQGTLSPVIAAILMPLSSVSIVLFGVGMSTWYAERITG